MTSPGGEQVGESAPKIRDRQVDLDGSRVHDLTAGGGQHIVVKVGCADFVG